VSPSIGVTVFNSTRLDIEMLIGLALVALNYVALAMIIKKAGYSLAWIILPLSPVILYVLAWARIFYDLFNTSYTPSGFAFPTALFHDEIPAYLLLASGVASFVCWVFFLIFAFSSWPVLRTRRSFVTVDTAAAIPPSTVPAGKPRTAAAAAAAGAAPSQPDGGSGVARTSLLQEERDEPAEAVAAPAQSIYCSWCGKERAADAVSIHHCGSKERPVRFCMRCGTAFSGDEVACDKCGTARSEISKY